MGRKRKWTKERVLKILKQMKKWMDEDTDIIYQGQLFVKADLRGELFWKWRKRFKDDEEISDLADRIREKLETRLNIGGLNQELNMRMVQFNLINHYSERWKDIRNVNFTGSIQKKVDEKVVSILDEINAKIDKKKKDK